MTTLSDVNWPHETERLRLRLPTLDDLEAVFAIRSLPEVYEFLTAAATDFDSFAAPIVERGHFENQVLITLGDVVIGDMMIRIEDGWGQREVADQIAGVQAELGWVLDPAHHGHGYMSEAVTAAIGICFNQLGLRRVVAGCFADNVPSWKLMERVGMRREGYYVSESLHRDGTWRDGMTYSILATEWPTEA